MTYYLLAYVFLWALPSISIMLRAFWKHPYDDFTVMDLLGAVVGGATLGWVGVLIYYGPRLVLRKNPRHAN